MTTRDKDHSDKEIVRMRADQKRLRSEIARLRKENHEVKKDLNRRDCLLRSFPVGFVVVEKTKIVEANEVILNQLGYSIEELLGRNWTDFVHPRLKNVIRGFQRRRASGKWAPEEYETDLVSKRGEILSCDVRVRKVYRSGRTAFLLMLTPSEKRKKMEKALVESKKREALARMAREMNTRLHPCLDGIAAFAETMRKRREPDRQGSKQMEDANREILRLSQALESFSREAPDPSKRALVDLKQVVRDAVAFAGPALKTHAQNGSGITLKTYLRAVSPVEGDSQELEEMLSHVMFNALEAMPNGGDLYLSIEDNAGHAYIYVQDRGMGIGPEVLERVFDPFFTTKEPGRPGLGLTLAQAIARRHQGTLELSSKKNEGTTVTIQLPLASFSKKKPNRRRKANELCILLIEDDPVIRDLVSKMLEHKGYRLSTASTGAEGLQQLARRSFDLVIVGSETPGMKGPDLIREIRKQKANLRVAWITGREARESKGKEKDRAADLIIRKPIDMTSTLESVSELLAG